MSTATAVPAEQAVGQAVVVHDRATSPTAIIDLLHLAIEKNIPVEALERLQALHERVSDRAAAAEFSQAIATFQAKCPPISKTSTAKIATNSGVSYSYRYAELDHIARTINPILRDVGLSYSWDSETLDKLLKCRCTLRHINGHQVTASFAAPVQSAAGMSEQQKHASALTYARRQSLIQVLGLTTCDPDTDGGNPEPITADQAVDLQALLEEKALSLTRFLKWAKVERLADILARDYESALNAIKAKESRGDAR